MVCAGVSARYGYDMNSLAVPRKAKEAIGGIASLQRPDGGRLTINVEYNLLDPLLRANGWADGDVNDATGYSPFPGKHPVDWICDPNGPTLGRQCQLTCLSNTGSRVLDIFFCT